MPQPPQQWQPADPYRHLPPPPPSYQPSPPVPRRPPAPQRDPSAAPKNPLIQERGRGGGRIGCLVALVFLVAAFYDVIQSLARALLDMVQ